MAAKTKKINKLLCFSALCSVLTVQNLQAKEIEMNTARLQAMDKITGKVSIVDVPVNGKSEFGTFSLVVRACKTRPPEETPENFAYVDIVDNYQTDDSENIFRGWMMSSSPALNAVSHPIYDVWLLKCLNTEVDKKKLLSAEELMLRNQIAKKEVDTSEPSLPQARKKPVDEQMENGDSENAEVELEDKSAIENPAVADEKDISVEEAAAKALDEAKAQPAEKPEEAESAPVVVEQPQADEPRDFDAPQALIKFKDDGSAEAAQIVEKPKPAPEVVPSEFIVIKEDNSEQAPAPEIAPQPMQEAAPSPVVDVPAEHEAMLPELLSNAKPISPEELEKTETHEDSGVAAEIPLVTGDEIEENGMVEDQLIEVSDPDEGLNLQAESLKD